MKENQMFHALLPILAGAINATMIDTMAEAAVNIGSSSWVWQNPLPQGAR